MCMCVATMLNSHNLCELQFVLNTLSLLPGGGWGVAFFLLNTNIN